MRFKTGEGSKGGIVGETATNGREAIQRRKLRAGKRVVGSQVAVRSDLATFSYGDSTFEA